MPIVTAERLAGKKIRLTREALKVDLDHVVLVEKVLLSLLEDIDDHQLTPTEGLMEATFLLE